MMRSLKFIPLCLLLAVTPVSLGIGSTEVQAQEISQTREEKKAIADQIFQKGNQQSRRNLYKAALQSWEQSLKIYREIGDRRGEAKALGNLGLAYLFLGEYETAITYHQRSLVIEIEVRDRGGEAASLGNLGIAYALLGKHEEAMAYHRRSLAIEIEIGNRRGEAISLGHIGLTYESLEKYEKANTYHQRSLAIKEQIGDRRGQAISLGALGNSYAKLENHKKAISHHQQSLAIKEEIGDLRGSAKSLEALGIIYYLLGKYERSITYHQQSLAINETIGDRRGTANALNSIGVSYEYLEEYPQAEQYLYQSIYSWELLRRDLNDSNQISIFDTHVSVYRNLQRVLLAQDKDIAALEVAEWGRSRALSQLLARALNKKSNLPDIEQIRAVARQKEATIVEYSLLANQALAIWVVNPSGDIQTKKVPLNDLQDSIESFSKQNRLWLEQVRGLDNKDTEISRILRGKSKSIDPLKMNHPPQSSENSLRTLYRYLIAPIKQYLPKNENEHVIFIPHRSLFQVPFAALIDNDGNYLLHSHTVYTAPSIYSLIYTDQHQQRVVNQGQDFLVVGNPVIPSSAHQIKLSIPLQDLKGTEKEAQVIAEQTGATPLIGKQATETEVKRRLHDAKLIHLASHGIFSDSKGNPLKEGYVVLAESEKDDGLLTVGEIIKLTQGNLLNAEMIVLSACETGVGDIRGEGVVGLSRALIAAGVPSVVVSLWNVNDESTSLLMRHFYHNLLDKKLDKATALREAMLEVAVEYPDPSYWAAFTLIGEAKSISLASKFSHRLID